MACGIDRAAAAGSGAAPPGLRGAAQLFPNRTVLDAVARLRGPGHDGDDAAHLPAGLPVGRDAAIRGLGGRLPVRPAGGGLCGGADRRPSLRPHGPPQHHHDQHGDVGRGAAVHGLRRALARLRAVRGVSRLLPVRDPRRAAGVAPRRHPRAHRRHQHRHPVRRPGRGRSHRAAGRRHARRPLRHHRHVLFPGRHHRGRQHVHFLHARDHGGRAGRQARGIDRPSRQSRSVIRKGAPRDHAHASAWRR